MTSHDQDKGFHILRAEDRRTEDCWRHVSIGGAGIVQCCREAVREQAHMPECQVSVGSGWGRSNFRSTKGNSRCRSFSGAAVRSTTTCTVAQTAIAAWGSLDVRAALDQALPGFAPLTGTTRTCRLIHPSQSLEDRSRSPLHLKHSSYTTCAWALRSSGRDCGRIEKSTRSMGGRFEDCSARLAA